MPVTIVKLVTVSCSLTGCDHEIACGGDEKYAEDHGWQRDYPIGDDMYDLCPECFGDLTAFLVGPGEDVELVDAMNTLDKMAQE